MKNQSVTAIIAVLIIGLILGCGKLGGITSNRSAPKEKYSTLLTKKEELANFASIDDSSVSKNGNPQIKGKVVIVKKDANGKLNLDRFYQDGEFSDSPVNKFDNFYPAAVYAKTPEEISTLIKIECREYKGKADYQYGSNSPSSYKEYVSTICNVSVIDYKTKTLLAKIQKGEEKPPIVLENGGNKSEIIEEVNKYLNSLPLELVPTAKPTPNGEVIAVAEIEKLSKKSKESLNQYQDKEITVTGWGAMTDSRDGILLYGNEKNTGVDLISCKIDAKDAVGFAEIKAYQKYKFVVIGKFDSKIKYAMRLEQCRFISAEEVMKK